MKFPPFPFGPFVLLSCIVGQRKMQTYAPSELLFCFLLYIYDCINILIKWDKVAGYVPKTCNRIDCFCFVFYKEQELEAKSLELYWPV